MRSVPLRMASALRLLRSDWSEIGGLGRFAVVGIAASLGLTLMLGLFIPARARTHLLEARASNLAFEVSELPDPLTIGHPGTQTYVEFDEAVEHELLGGETETVKVWTRDGRIAYSDDPRLVGRSFELTPVAAAAFEGEVQTQVSRLRDPAHELDRELGRLIEVFVPVAGPNTVDAVVEVEQRVDSLDQAMTAIERNVWLSILTGMLTLATFFAALAIARVRDLHQKRRQSERLLGALFRAQEDERKRIVSALHDDIGQPLYRVLYGLEGSRAKLPPGHVVSEELGRLEHLVTDMDAALRDELRSLRLDLAADAGLGPALSDLAATTTSESGLDVHTDYLLEDRLDEVKRTALYRAAREAIMNVRRHANASEVWIRAQSVAGSAQVSVSDNGSGDRIRPGLGITTTRERLEALGGRVDVVSTPGHGTTFTASVPLDGSAP